MKLQKVVITDFELIHFKKALLDEFLHDEKLWVRKYHKIPYSIFPYCAQTRDDSYHAHVFLFSDEKPKGVKNAKL